MERSHPWGVQAESSMFLTGGSHALRDRGLGPTLAALSDEAILATLAHLGARDLCVLSTVSKSLYCFCNHDELWKALVLTELEGSWSYAGSWQETYLRSPAAPGYAAGAKRPRRVAGFYSDLLHQPWMYATVDIDPGWLETDNVERRAGLTGAQFREEYEGPNRPVIITDAVPGWPARTKWSRPYLAAAFGAAPAIVGDAPLPFPAYCAYADANRDEMPLYLFDKRFAEKAPALASDYSVPPCFEEDLFSVLGAARPDHRWLIIGPPRSGSTFHQDPNATSAWNAVVSGAKKWVLYPPSATPPGVRPSADGADVASPVSLMEWFINFYAERAAGGCRPLECTLKAGEVLFVPRGWWHTAINLVETVAITQNFVSAANLSHVLAFLKTGNPDLISGLASEEDRASLHDRFSRALRKRRPEALEAAEAEAARRRDKAKALNKLSLLFNECGTEAGAEPAAAAAGDSQPAQPSGFSFGFRL